MDITQRLLRGITSIVVGISFCAAHVLAIVVASRPSTDVILISFCLIPGMEQAYNSHSIHAYSQTQASCPVYLGPASPHGAHMRGNLAVNLGSDPGGQRTYYSCILYYASNLRRQWALGCLFRATTDKGWYNKTSPIGQRRRKSLPHYRVPRHWDCTVPGAQRASSRDLGRTAKSGLSL